MVISIDIDLKRHEYLFHITDRGVDVQSFVVPEDALGMYGDPDTWKALIKFGWQARGHENDEAQKSKG